MEIKYSNYAQRYMIGSNINYELAVKLKLNLNMNNAMNYGYEILANEETRNYEYNYNFIVTHNEKQALEAIIPVLEKAIK